MDDDPLIDPDPRLSARLIEIRPHCGTETPCGYHTVLAVTADRYVASIGISDTQSRDLLRWMLARGVPVEYTTSSPDHEPKLAISWKAEY